MKPLAVVLFLLAVSLLALAGELTKQPDGERCALDGAAIPPLTRVSIKPPEDKELHFCSLCCARGWLTANPGIATALAAGQGSITVTDEVSGEAMDAGLAYWVRSGRFSRRANHCRMHVFREVADASRHLLDFKGEEAPGFLAGLGRLLPRAGRFEARDLAGKHFRLADLEKVIIFLRFWNSANPLVVDDLKELEKAFRRFQGRGFTVVAVNVDEPPDRARILARQLELTFPVVSDPEGTIGDQYEISGFPTGFLIDRAGLIRQRTIGEVTAEVMESLLNGLR